MLEPTSPFIFIVFVSYILAALTLLLLFWLKEKPPW